MRSTVFPARAGMSRSRQLSPGRRSCVPRASGDEPGLDMLDFFAEGCSPRERG